MTSLPIFNKNYDKNLQTPLTGNIIKEKQTHFNKA